MASTQQPRFLMVETSDSQTFHIPMALMSSAAAIRALFSDSDSTQCWEEDSSPSWSSGAGPAEPCVLPEVRSRVFKRIIEWCRAHRGVTDDSDSLEARAFERSFLNLPPDDLLELISAAQYLGIERLFCEATRRLNMHNSSPK